VTATGLLHVGYGSIRVLGMSQAQVGPKLWSLTGQRAVALW